MVFMVKNLPTAKFFLRGKSEKYTKENMLVERFGSHFSQIGPFNLISWQDCYIFNALSTDTHISNIQSHKAIWLYSHMAKLWPYGHIAIWPYGHKSSQYGCLWIEYQKCGKVVKKLNWKDHYVRNESQNAPPAYFPLYIFRISPLK